MADGGFDSLKDARAEAYAMPLETIDVSLGERFRDVLDHGISILLIDHDMTLVLEVCDYLYVLEFGRLIAEGTPAEVRGNDDVIAAYLGEGARRAKDATGVIPDEASW